MLERKIYSIDSVVSIDKEELTYKDESGEISSLSLIVCRKNWVMQMNKSRKLADNNGEPAKLISEEDTNCVGLRDWFAEKPYFEFCEDDIVRFEMILEKKPWDIFNKNWKERYYPVFAKIKSDLYDAGWTTFDLG